MRRFGELRSLQAWRGAVRDRQARSRHVRGAVGPCRDHAARRARPCHADDRSGAGQFLAEIGQLSGRVALVDGHAEGDVETLLIPPDKLRALLMAEADLGERIMRALILRRVSLIQGGAGGPVLIGPAALGDMARLAEFSGAQRPAASSARSRNRQGRRRPRRALFGRAQRSAAGRVSRRHRAAQSVRDLARARDGHDHQPCA